MPQYPLNESMPDQLRAASGRAYAEVTLDAVAEGTLSADDLAVDASTLQAQATIAEEAGFPQLASNLRRAAELTAVPNDELLQMYELLRPGRGSHDELVALAETLADYLRGRRDRIVRARGRRRLSSTGAVEALMTRLVVQIAPQRNTQYAGSARSLAPHELALSPLAARMDNLQMVSLGGQDYLSFDLTTILRTRP